MTFLESVGALLKPKQKKKRPVVPGAPIIDEDEGEEETQAERDERHRFMIAWFRRLRDDVEYRVEQLTEHLSDGRIDSRQWAAAFRKELADAHTEAHVIGRRLAGHVGPFNSDDRVAGDAAWQRQEQYFEKFLADLERGRYNKTPDPEEEPEEEDPEDGEGEEGEALNERAFNARALQYVTATRGTVHESFRSALGKESTNWNLGLTDHCKPSKGFAYNCPDLAAQSPKPADEWETAPARGDCPCRGNCSCFFSTADGSHSTEGI